MSSARYLLARISKSDMKEKAARPMVKVSESQIAVAINELSNLGCEALLKSRNQFLRLKLIR
jgi:hypothetical protein